ncbi:MAG TPA: response regulator transcription factor [Candidatus Saccharimonadales bacterium]|nr:response regulator transcription factor [Candidatus Saccharimonadales bacterium]
MIRVFLIAALPLARAALQNRFKGQSVKIVGSATSVDALGGDLSDSQADVLLVDASGESPEAIIESLAYSDLATEVPTVILAEPGSPSVSAQALQAGIRSMLPSESSTDQLIAALQAAAAGLVVLHPSEIPAVFPAASPASQRLAELPEPLTRREREVLQMLAAGLANKEIAARLNISDHTAKFHVAAILGKLGAATRTEAVALGIRRGLVLL